MPYTSNWTGGLDNQIVALSISDSYELAANERRQNISVTCSAASKTVTLGMADGETCIITNVGGTNAVTIKNVSGDTGVSLGAGKVAYVIASKTADASVIKVLN